MGAFAFSRGRLHGLVTESQPMSPSDLGDFTFFPCSKLFCFHPSSGSGEVPGFFLVPRAPVSVTSPHQPGIEQYIGPFGVSWLLPQNVRQTVRILSVYKTFVDKSTSGTVYDGAKLGIS